MSFDAFEARLHFLQLLRKLNASQLSIQKVVAYAIKYGSRCGEDLWECIMEECSKGSLNTRINILYFLDSLLEACQPLLPGDAPYLAFTARDLPTIVQGVVPDAREGILNLKSARQILESWRLRRLVDHHIVEQAINDLDARKLYVYRTNQQQSNPSSPKKRTHEESFSRTDILRRMEEDRERHKRLRERIWILPIPPVIPPTSRSLPSRTPANTALNLQSPASTSASPATPASPSGSGRKNLNVAPPPPSTTTSAGQSSDNDRDRDKGRMRPPPVPPPKEAGPVVASEEGRTGAGSVAAAAAAAADPLEVEFDLLWETGSELDEEDLVRMNEQARIARSAATAA